MEGQLLQPRDLVLQYGVLPPSVFAALDCVGSVQTAHRSLAAVATTAADGHRVVGCDAVASVLGMPAEQSQLLLDMVAAVSNEPSSSTAGGVDVYALSLLLMAQLHKRETQKPETADHWPELSSTGGSPVNASSSRTLIKQQLQQQRRQQLACSRAYADFLQKHQIALLELVMDDSSTAVAWQQQRAAQIQQHKAAQLQVHEPQEQQQQHPHMPSQPAVAQDQEEQQLQQQQNQQHGNEAEMTPADEVLTAEQSVSAAAAAAPVTDEPMQSSPTRHDPDNTVSSNQQQQLDLAQPLPSQLSLGSTQISLGRTSNAAVPPVEVSAAEFDRLGFLLEVVSPSSRKQAGHRSSAGGGLSAEFAAIAAAAGDTSSSSSTLSQHVPGYSASSTLMMEDLVTWMNNSWLHIQQQKLAAAAVAAAHNNLTAGAAPTAEAPAAAGSDGGSSALATGLSTSPPGDSMMMVLGSSPPSTSLLGTAGAANLGMNGLLPAINTGVGSTSSLVTPTASSTVAAAGGLGGLSSIRINAARGVVAVSSGTVDDHGVSGVYRGTVVRGPDDVTRDEITIQNCIECHIYILAAVKLARVSNCTDCTVCIGAAGTLLRVDCCERLQLTAAAGQVLVVSCHSCCLHLGTPKQPALLGDCRFIKLAPYNTRYETVLQHLNAANISTNQPSMWDQPLVISSTSSSSATSSSGGSSSSSKSEGGGSASVAQLQQQRRPGCSTPSSPHTHSSSGGANDRRSGAAPGKTVMIMQPDEYLPLVVPFKGTSGPLAGGAAHPISTHWLPGSHKQQQGPLPPFPFDLPEPFDSALQQQYSVVTDLRNRIRNSGLDDSRRNQLQAVIQSYFREWLHSSGAIRQVYDLSKLEGDEYGPLNGSPPAGTFLRDHSQL